MSDCIFCRIHEIAGKRIFYEDEEFVAFLSKYPNTPGYSVLIPKEHYGSNIMELPDDVLSRMFITAKKVAGILKDYYSDVGRVAVITEGMGVNHAYIKLFPMHGTGFLEKEWRQMESEETTFITRYTGYVTSMEGKEVDEEELEELAGKIKENFTNRQ